MLKWEPTDFLACLGVAPSVGDYEVSHHYRIERDGLSLDLTVKPFDGDIHLALRRDGVNTPVVDVRLIGCDAARRIQDERGTYLEFAAGRLFGGRYDGDAPIPYGIRVRVDPSLAIEFFRASDG